MTQNDWPLNKSILQRQILHICICTAYSKGGGGGGGGGGGRGGSCLPLGLIRQRAVLMWPAPYLCAYMSCSRW